MDLQFLWLLYGMICTWLQHVVDGSVIVETLDGKLEGYEDKSRFGKTFQAFEGVPYAKPPLGSLRFSEPQPVTPWEGVRPAKAPTICIGYTNFAPKDANLNKAYGQEDCLHLSIYTKSLDASAKKPVILYIYGGGFGSRTLFGYYSKANYFMDYDIVLVQVNYRVAMFGFLDFYDGVLPKNVGLKDMLLGLKWVNKNIEFFGGDPNQVTVMGESAGAASAHFLAISPATEGLIHRAILLSGSGYTRWAWATSDHAKFVANHAAEFTNCTRPTTAETVDCLRAVDGESLIAVFPEIEKRFGTPDSPVNPFAPTISSIDSSEPFLRGFPKDWPPMKIPIITNFDSGEGLVLTMGMNPLIIGKEYDFSHVNERFDHYLLEVLMINDSLTPGKDDVLKFVKNRYFGGKDHLTPKDLDALVNLFTDTFFLAPLYELIQNTEGDVHLYKNDFQGVISFAPNFGKLNQTGHCTQLFHLFDYGLIPQMPEVDLAFSKDLLQALVDFSSGKKPLKWGSLEWPSTQKDEIKLLLLHSSGHKIVGCDDLKAEYETWHQLGPRRLAYN